MPIGPRIYSIGIIWDGRIRTCECRYQKPVAYRLPTSHRHRIIRPDYKDGEQDLETATSIASLDAMPGGPARGRFVTAPPLPPVRQPPPAGVRRWAVDDDELADFDDFDDFDDFEDDDDMEEDDDFDYDDEEDEFDDAFADEDGNGDGGLADSYFDRASGAGREPPSR